MKKLIIVTLLFLMSVPVFATDNIVYTVDMRTWMRTYLYDENGATWTDNVCDRLLNMRSRWFATFCGIGKIDTIVTVNNQVRYPLNDDFLATDKVAILISGEKRWKALDRRAFSRSDPSLKTYGGDNSTTHPLYYTIVQVADSTYWILLDAPEAETGTDSIFVFYRAQATELTGDSTVTNIPYSGIQLVVLGAVLDGLIMNRENPTSQLVIPIVNEMFKEYFELYMRDYSAPAFRQGQ